MVVWQLNNPVAARYRSVRIGGWTPGRWSALLLGVLTIAVALGLVVDLIVSNVGAVSASAPAYEANLLALVARVAVLFGLPHPETLAPLVGQIDLAIWIRTISLTLLSFASNIGLVALYVAFMLLEQATFDRKSTPFSRIRSARPRSAGCSARSSSASSAICGSRHLQPRHGGLSWCVLTAVGCQQAGFWALIIFMINYIPIVGSFFGVLFPSLLVLVQFGTLGPFVATIVGLPRSR